MSLDALITEIEHRFGYKSLRRASELVRNEETIATGIGPLDTLLDGGLLVGGTHGIAGLPTSGATSLVYQIIAHFQTQDLPVVYLDMAHEFDPPNAATLGVQMDHLLLTSPLALKNVLFLLQTLAQHRIPCLVVVDGLARLPLSQLRPTLRQAPVTLLTLTPEPLPHMQVALFCQHESWQFAGQDVVRFTSTIRLTRHPFLAPRTTQLTFAIPKEDERA